MKSDVYFNAVKFYVMVHNIILVSAATPAILFSYLLINLRINHLNYFVMKSDVLTQKSIPHLSLQQIVESHFTKRAKIKVMLYNKTGQLPGYISVQKNRIYSLCLTNEKEILALKKNHFGWSVLRLHQLVERPEQYVTPLIVCLEGLFFN